MQKKSPFGISSKHLPLWAKALLVCAMLLGSSGLQIESTVAAWQVSASIAGNTVTTGVWATASIATDGDVVLNEFLPNPSGDDHLDKPDGEWVELYNNENFDIDLSGWYVTDSLGSPSNTVKISSSTANLHLLPATTTIPAKGFLVVYLNDDILNNSGDTVKLFNSSDVEKDSHSYNTTNECTNTATPGNPNVDDSTGSCNTVPEGKSFARFIDGTGAWVDPEPTPGEGNRFSRQDLIDSGFSEEMIEGMVALLEARGEYLIGEEPDSVIQPIASSTETIEVTEENEVLEGDEVEVTSGSGGGTSGDASDTNTDEALTESDSEGSIEESVSEEGVTLEGESTDSTSENKTEGEIESQNSETENIDSALEEVETEESPEPDTESEPPSEPEVVTET